MRTAWEQAVHSMQQMYQASVVKPDNLYEIFRVDAGAAADEVKLLVGPIVFNVPERPNRAKADLYIVVEGWLTFEGPDFKAVPLRTKNFGTQVGYFRSKAGALEHVYGAHYDMDEVRPGHPVFHAQIGPQLAFGCSVRDQFSVEGEVTADMGNILKTVRTPSAQMDVFAVMTQICADHLIWKDSSEEVMGAFTGLGGPVEGGVAPPGLWAVLRIEDADGGVQVVDVHRQGADVGLKPVAVLGQFVALGDQA